MILHLRGSEAPDDLLGEVVAVPDIRKVNGLIGTIGNASIAIARDL
jgi:hypothetical protein